MCIFNMVRASVFSVFITILDQAEVMCGGRRGHPESRPFQEGAIIPTAAAPAVASIRVCAWSLRQGKGMELYEPAHSKKSMGCLEWGVYKEGSRMINDNTASIVCAFLHEEDLDAMLAAASVFSTLI